MALTDHATPSGVYNTLDPVANTDRRDVSEMLDLSHQDTPFLNRVSWGEASSAKSIEWITEHLGMGFVELATGVDASSAIALASAASYTVDLSSYGRTTSQILDQIHSGMVLYAYDSTNSSSTLYLVETCDGDGALGLEILSGDTATIAAGEKLYIVAGIANEGSSPLLDRSRDRIIRTNAMTIQRKDVQITGSQKETDYYAVNDELQHQIAMRTVEMNIERERNILLMDAQTRSATVAGTMNGCYGYLTDSTAQTGGHIVTSATDFTETAFNNMVAELYENGGNPDVLVGSVSQIRKFTSWDTSRVRSAPDNKVGGYHVASYLTDVGREVELIGVKRFPRNIAFCLDTSLMKLRPKSNRKLFVEKLGKNGDYDQWQLISEYTMEFRGYDMGKQGMWSALNA